MPPLSPLLPTYTAKQVKQNGKQFYLDDRDRPLPSVSTILNATRSPEQRQALANWQQRIGTVAAAEITTTASRRGTGTHKQIQRWLQGEAVLCPDNIRPYWESIKPVLLEVEEVRLVEGLVLHKELGYGGKVDCIASYQGVPCLCEWKTADRPKHKLEYLNDYPLQVAAYWGAVNQFYGDQGVQLDHALVAIAVPDQVAEVFWLDAAAIAPYWQQWEERVAMFWRRWGGR